MLAKAQSAAAASMAHQKELILAAVEVCEAKPGNTRLQNFVCLAIPAYNVFAALEGWPVIPVPAFCTTPAKGVISNAHEITG